MGPLVYILAEVGVVAAGVVSVVGAAKLIKENRRPEPPRRRRKPTRHPQGQRTQPSKA
jgi:hypothetical protein